MNPKIYPIYIEFLDHRSNSAWMDKNELKEFEPILVYQVGWLVEETPESYKVSGQVTEDGDAGDTICILKSTVRKFKRTKV